MADGWEGLRRTVNYCARRRWFGMIQWNDFLDRRQTAMLIAWKRYQQSVKAGKWHDRFIRRSAENALWQTDHRFNRLSGRPTRSIVRGMPMGGAVENLPDRNGSHDVERFKHLVGDFVGQLWGPAAEVARLLCAGYGSGAIARQMAIDTHRVTQIRARLRREVLAFLGDR